jgi:hypothetical protein
MADEMVKVWKVRPLRGGRWLYCRSQEEITDTLDGDSRENYEIVETEMERENLDALPEFEGW